MVRNPASGRVMQKIRMRHAGTLPGHIEKNGVREDCERYEILRYEWDGVDRCNA
jgi:RimJ/RimL family protein N-acetyltransferase